MRRCLYQASARIGSHRIWARLTEEGSSGSDGSGAGAVGGIVLVLACCGVGRGGKSRGVMPGIIPNGAGGPEKGIGGRGNAAGGKPPG